MTQTRPGYNESMTDQAAATAHDTIERAADVGNEAEQNVRRAAARTAKQARQLQDRARDMRELADDKVERLRSYAKDNPLTTVGIAFAVGAIVSALLRR